MIRLSVLPSVCVAALGAAVASPLAQGLQGPVVPPPGSRAPIYSYQVVRSYPHDRDGFTQGFEYVDGFFYEGTGLNGRSSIRRVKPDTGEVVQRRDVPQDYFGEGITIWKNDLIELTWVSGRAFVSVSGMPLSW